uniref:Uncharacterized protein n=1 Tax=Plectus sambesii TaxID=2011161 RepID=A0A914ULG5_9BILA
MPRSLSPHTARRHVDAASHHSLIAYEPAVASRNPRRAICADRMTDGVQEGLSQSPRRPARPPSFASRSSARFSSDIAVMDVVAAAEHLLACPCLNVQLRVRAASLKDTIEMRAILPMKIRDGFNAEAPFVAHGGGVNKDSTRSASWIKAAIPALVNCFQSDEEDWDVIWCLLCGTTVAAVFQSCVSPLAVISTNLLSSSSYAPSQPSIAAMSSCPAPSTTLFVSEKLLLLVSHARAWTAVDVARWSGCCSSRGISGCGTMRRPRKGEGEEGGDGTTG